MKKTETTIEDALRARSFETLAIKRIDRECYLVVTIAGTARVLTDRKGDRMMFRHAWQVRDWLQDSFRSLQKRYRSKPTDEHRNA